MQILIEISEAQKKMVDAIMELPPQVENDLISAIRHGTPLPEHHRRLIEDCFSDGDSNDNWHTVFNDDTGCYENVVLLDDIKSAPTIIPATKEKSCATCGQPRNYANQCILFKEGKCVERYEKWKPATKDGESE